MPKGRRKEKKKSKKMPPSSYLTMPHYSHYFPQQVDIVKRAMKSPKKAKKEK